MNDKQLSVIRRLFGSAWQELTTQTDALGAFVLWHDTREFYADKNTARLLGSSDKLLTYEELSSVAQYADVDGGNSLPNVTTMLVDSGDLDVTAGVVMRVREDNEQPSFELPVSTQAQLSEIITTSNEGAFLMLIQLEHIDYARDEGSFLRSAIEAIRKTAPEGTVIASHTRLQYWVYVPNNEEDPHELAKRIRKSVIGCDITDEFGVLISSAHSMTMTGGYVADCSCSSSAVTLLHYSAFALFEALSEKVGSLKAFSKDSYDLHKNDYHTVQSFTTLLDKNLFSYHFQPIVSAKDGSIVAYEALMRTDKNIGLNPLQILEMAEKYDRLYEIEYATMFNVMGHMSRNQGYFKKRKLFINSIPSCFLSEEDWGTLVTNYGELLEKVVIELTEQTESSEESLRYGISRIRDHKMRMAIDDFGTGYSNTSRLIKFTPDYIKIDRSLVSHIDTNVRLQSIVSGLVEMMHSNGFAVLGEGVETTEELRTLIGMNVDLFQGFYISKPKPIFINEISENVRAEIIRYNLEAKENQNKIYYAEDGAEIKLEELIREHYTSIHAAGGDIRIVGDKDSPEVNIPITIKEDSDCRLELENIRIEADQDEPAIALGNGAQVVISVKGDNLIRKSGILVPSKASVVLEGDGDLTILPEAVNCYGIGNEEDLTYGKITVNMTGELRISTNGDFCVGIGGGRSDSGSPIELNGGKISIVCSGAMSIGVGSVHERANVTVKNCDMKIDAASAVFVGIGSHDAAVSLNVFTSSINITSGGNKMCGIGLLGGHSCFISIEDSTLNTVMRGRDIIHVGTNDGVVDARFYNSKVTLYGEGSSISGIGDSVGDGKLLFQDTDLDITFMTGNGFGIGFPSGNVEFIGGSKNIHIND